MASVREAHARVRDHALVLAIDVRAWIADQELISASSHSKTSMSSSWETSFSTPLLVTFGESVSFILTTRPEPSSIVV